MRALIVTDVQNDFVPGGALPVPEGDRVVPLANRLMQYFDLIVATKDWHPPDHGSFASRHPGKKPGEVIDLDGLEQILWPDHCVQGTPGAEFVTSLQTGRIDHITYKGADPRIDSYSTFFDNGHRRATDLGDYLRERGVTEVDLVGLATDYCVKFSALDARQLGFETFVIEDACRGINLRPGDVEKALDEMRAAGVHIIQASDVAPELVR